MWESLQGIVYAVAVECMSRGVAGVDRCRNVYRYTSCVICIDLIDRCRCQRGTLCTLMPEAQNSGWNMSTVIASGNSLLLLLYTGLRDVQINAHCSSHRSSSCFPKLLDYPSKMLKI